MSHRRALWKRLGHPPPGHLERARIETHHAAQWLARIARAALSARADDSQMNLSWDDARQTLFSRDLPAKDGIARMGLSFVEGSLVMVQYGKVIARQDLLMQTERDIARWAEMQASQLGIDPLSFGYGFPYTLPAHAVQHGQPYGLRRNDPAVMELGRWFANADLLFQDIRAALPHRRPGPTEARIWPHHYDLGLLLPLEEGDLERVPAVGVGLSPGDTLFNEPYFYVRPYPVNSFRTLPPLPAPAGWHTEQFTGAIIRGTDVVRLANQFEETRATLQACIDACFDLLRYGRWH